MALVPSIPTRDLASIEDILTAKWLKQSPPRLSIGSIVGNKYKITSVKRNGGKYQLLLAVDTNPADPSTVGSLYVLKAIRTGRHEGHYIKTHLEWMRATESPEGRIRLIDDFQEGEIHFMIFPKQGFTLRDVLNDQSLSPIPAQHVQEISFQLVNAVRHLQRQFTLHGDVCPENIELLRDEKVLHMTYDQDRDIFNQKHILFCTKLQLAYYGDFGLQSSLGGMDQYRAPEVVFGAKFAPAADSFSVGCVIAELVLGEPLFPPCEESSSVYRNEKALLYDAVSGRFSEEMAGKIELFYPLTMDMSEVRPIRYAGISSTVESFIDRAIHIEQWVFDNDDPAIGEIIAGLVRTIPRARRSLASTLQCDYFQNRYR